MGGERTAGKKRDKEQAQDSSGSEHRKDPPCYHVGKLRPQPSHCHDGSKVKISLRPIIVRFQLWKDKEMVVKKARQLKPESIQFQEDYLKRTLDRKKEKIPELIQARKRGKRASLVKDRLSVTDAGPNLRDNVTYTHTDNA